VCTPGGLFFCIMNQAMISLFGVLQSFPVERAMFVREVQNGYYRYRSRVGLPPDMFSAGFTCFVDTCCLHSVSTYYLSKTVSDIPFQVVFPIVFVTIVYWMMDLRDDAARYFAILGFIILCANCAISMGFFVAAVSPNINVSMALGPMLIFPQVMFCGFLLNTASIPIVSWRVCVCVLGMPWFPFSGVVVCPCCRVCDGLKPSASSSTPSTTACTFFGMTSHWFARVKT
jgi:ABC-type multidrug transport system permease subunit